MRAYTVENVQGDPREWQSNYGPMLSYTLSLKDQPGVAEISQKPDTPAPKAGDVIEGELIPSANGNFPPKLKRAKPQGGGFGGGGGMSPEREKRIVRQHSQAMAIETLKLAREIGVWPEDKAVTTVADLVACAKSVADVYDKDAGV